MPIRAIRSVVLLSQVAVAEAIGAGIPTLVTDFPLGRLLASKSRDNTVRLWEAQTGQELRQFVNHTPIQLAEFSPDGTWLFVERGDRRRRSIGAEGNLWVKGASAAIGYWPFADAFCSAR